MQKSENALNQFKNIRINQIKSNAVDIEKPSVPCKQTYRKIANRRQLFSLETLVLHIKRVNKTKD